MDGIENDIIDDPKTEKPAKHEFYLSWNRVELKGLFAWAFWIQAFLWFFRGLLYLTADITTFWIELIK